MDVNKVTFGDFSIGSKGASTRRNEERKEEQNIPVSGENVQNVDAEKLLSAMNIAAMQNLAQVSKSERKEINPADYLSAERIADIEAMMGGFDDGVNKAAQAVRQELPAGVSEKTVYELAARMYAAQ